MKSITRAMVALAAVSGAATAVAKADAPNLSAFPNSPIFNAVSDGTVRVTYLFSRASFTNYLVLFDAIGGTGTTLLTIPGSWPSIGVSTPTFVDIAVTAGQQLIFGVCSDGATGGSTSTACTTLTGGDVGNTWYNGIAAPDGFIHSKELTSIAWNSLNDFCDAGVPEENPPCFDAPDGHTVVGFEDKVIPNPQGGDEPDFNDVVFSFSNVSTVPEPATMGLLALGLVGMSGAGLLRRRANRKNTK